MCENKDFNKCMKCERFSVNAHHGYRDRPSEEIIIGIRCGTKRWKYINKKYVYIEENE